MVGIPGRLNMRNPLNITEMITEIALYLPQYTGWGTDTTPSAASIQNLFNFATTHRASWIAIRPLLWRAIHLTSMVQLLPGPPNSISSPPSGSVRHLTIDLCNRHIRNDLFSCIASSRGFAHVFSRLESLDIAVTHPDTAFESMELLLAAFALLGGMFRPPRRLGLQINMYSYWWDPSLEPFLHIVAEWAKGDVRHLSLSLHPDCGPTYFFDRLEKQLVPFIRGFATQLETLEVLIASSTGEYVRTASRMKYLKELHITTATLLVPTELAWISPDIPTCYFPAESFPALSQLRISPAAFYDDEQPYEDVNLHFLSRITSPDLAEIHLSADLWNCTSVLACTKYVATRWPHSMRKFSLQINPLAMADIEWIDVRPVLAPLLACRGITSIEIITYQASNVKDDDIESYVSAWPELLRFTLGGYVNVDFMPVRNVPQITRRGLQHFCALKNLESLSVHVNFDAPVMEDVRGTRSLSVTTFGLPVFHAADAEAVHTFITAMFPNARGFDTQYSDLSLFPDDLEDTDLGDHEDEPFVEWTGGWPDETRTGWPV